MKNKLEAFLLIGFGFVLGCMVVDCMHLNDVVTKRQAHYDYGRLLLYATERPDNCPNCGYKFIYLYELDEVELQDIVDNYLGKLPYNQEILND